MSGFVRTVRTRRVETADERLAWLLIVATVPADFTGLAPRALAAHAVRQAARRCGLPHAQRRGPARQRQAARRRSSVRALAVEHGVTRSVGGEQGRRLDTLDVQGSRRRRCRTDRCAVRRHQPLGIAHGRWACSRLLDHESAARFSFLLATPIILAAGVCTKNSGSRWTSRRWHPCPGPCRCGISRSGRLHLRSLPHAVLPDSDPVAVHQLQFSSSDSSA